jgi:PAS domain S-box-containing protein
MELVSDGHWPLLAAMSFVAAVVGVALAILAIGTLRRAARRMAAQIEEIRRHAPIGELAPESDPGLRALAAEINLLLRDLRSRLRLVQGRSGDLQALIDGPPDLALVSSDAAWRILSFSRGAAHLTGWAREEILDHHLETLFAPGEWERILPKLARRSLRDAGIADTVRLQRRDGSTFPAHVSIGPAQGEAGGAGAILLTAFDLTSQDELERRLRDAEEGYRRLVEGIGDGVFIVQSDRLAYANPALARLLGVEREALMGMPFKDLVSADDLLRVQDHFRRVERGELPGSGTVDCRLARRGGGPIEARIAWGATDLQGRRAVVGAVADLTERARVERKIALSEARLQAALHSTGDGILVIGAGDRGLRAIVANRAFCSLFGVHSGQLAAMEPEALKAALDERSSAPGALQEFLAGALAPGEGEFRLEGLELATPGRALVDLVAGPVRSASGEIVGRILTVRDVTARADMESSLRKSLDDLGRAKSELEAAYRDLTEAQSALSLRNQQLETLNAELKSLDEMKSALLANVSHELHTPLVSIKGYTEMILKRRLGPLTPEQERGLGVALKNIDRLVEMIDNLLSFSRMEKGETQLHLEDVPFWQLVDEAVELVGERVRKKNVTITTQYEADDLIVRADRTKLGQVLTNLLTNAVKFNREGGRITIAARRGDRGFIEVDVEDTGIGIPAEEQEKIFERFYQVDASPSRKYEGTGIGLSIVRDILRLHGCSIRVTSEAGKGSVFTFTLPLAREAKPSEARPPIGRGRSRE